VRFRYCRRATLSSKMLPQRIMSPLSWLARQPKVQCVRERHPKTCTVQRTQAKFLIAAQMMQDLPCTTPTILKQQVTDIAVADSVRAHHTQQIRLSAPPALQAAPG